VKPVEEMIGPNGAHPGRTVARTASIHIDDACNEFLSECFKPFGIQLVPLEGDPVTAFQRQKFEACLLRLYDPEAERILEAARHSSSNRGVVIYGIAHNAKEVLRHARFGINAVFDEPLDRVSVLKVVRASHLLVINELRRYARVPVVGETEIETPMGKVRALTVEVSSGGMSVRSRTPLSPANSVTATLELPGTSRFSLRAFVWWARPDEKVYGLRFDPSDERRGRVRDWIEEYLEV
jgi:hypothetical protein